MSAASATTLAAHLDSVQTEILDRRAEGRSREELIWLRNDLRRELIERFPCERCSGSGMVAVGPWGSRPPSETCPVCAGRRYEV